MLKVLVYTQLSPVLDMLADDVVVEFRYHAGFQIPTVQYSIHSDQSRTLQVPEISFCEL